MEEKLAVSSLAALAQGFRLRIFRALVGTGPKGLTPGALSATLDVAHSTLSFHLKDLMHSGLVTQQRVGRNLVYRPSIDQMNELMAYLTAHCCQEKACQISNAVSCTPALADETERRPAASRGRLMSRSSALKRAGS